jgi:hypothetical protein
MLKNNVILPTTGIGRQSLKPSPVYPDAQLQIGEWFMTLQSAFEAQVPGQGSTHFWLMQALWDGQSELTKHSGAEPIIFGRQPHWACPETTWHCELGPHGDGVQGLGGMGRNVPSSTTGLGTGATNVKLIRLFTNVQCSEVDVRQFSEIMLTRYNVTTS